MLDNLKIRNYEKSFFMIKPDAYQYKNDILKELIEAKFELQYIRDVTLKREFLMGLYSTEDDEVVNQLNIEYLMGKTATIGIVAGKKCKKRLLEICGESFIPDMCDKKTIRYKYSNRRDPIMLNGHEFYINAIHRALPQDADDEIKLVIKNYMKM